jgi:hypothetical protein
MPDPLIPVCPIHRTFMDSYTFDGQPRNLWHGAAKGFRCGTPDCRVAYMYGMFEGLYNLEATGQLTRYFPRSWNLERR